MQRDFSIWYKSTSEKILAWRNLRENLKDKNQEEIINEVNNWWTFTPWVKKTIDPFKPETWPTPWDMINKGEFCRSAIALGQAYTLWMSCPEMFTELWLVNNFSEKDVHLIAVIDESDVLNYTLGQVLNVKECSFEILNKIDKSYLTHIKL